MRRLLLRTLLALSCLVWPVVATAQTSTIAGTVRDASGGVLPGVTVEVASPALIEKARTVVTDEEGRYSVVSLRPGIYTVTFTLPGFGIVKRDGIELTSDFTAVVNTELRVGTLEETITVTGESPIVDTQSITQRVVMTRDVMDVLPTGRNIQAVGILVPGTTLALGGGGALSRDVGGSGQMQQSPLQYRGSADTVQTIEGIRLNNLCAQGAYSGVYWNDASFEEFSYVTGADSAEMGQGGMRVNMVPRDGGNQFRVQMFGNYAGDNFTSDNCQLENGFCSRDNLSGSTTFNRTNNTLTNVEEIIKIWDFNPSIGGPILRDRLWFNYTFRMNGTHKTKVDSYFDQDPLPTRYVPDLTRKGIDDGHIRSNAFRFSWAATSKDKVSYYHDDQAKYRNHWGIASLVPPEAAAIQVTPTSFVSVTKWTRTHTNRLLLEGGFGYYNQEYTELYQPDVTQLDEKVWDLQAIRNSKTYNVQDAATGRHANAWPNPADHFSVLRTFMGAASYVTGSHSFRFGATLTNGDWREVRAWTGDVQPILYNAGNPQSVTLRLPFDRANGVKRDLGLFAQDKWVMGRVTWNLGLRFDQFIGESRESSILENRLGVAPTTFGECSDGQWDPGDLCAGEVQNWKDISPRVGFAMDVFGNGRTAVKASFARYVAGQAIAFVNEVNPIGALIATDTRGWTAQSDADRNGLPIDANGNIQFNELTNSANTPSFGQLRAPTTQYDTALLEGWGKRGYNMEYTIAAQHQLADRVSINGGYFRRYFENDTFTDDLRFDASHYDYFCVAAPADPDLPNGGGYQVCGIPDFKSTTNVTQAANSLIRFTEDFGGTTNMFEGFDVNLEARLRGGAFVKGGIAAGARTFDNCNLAQAGIEYATYERYEDGSSQCHRRYGFRPDVKLSGSYPLPLNMMLAGTYQFVRGVQAGGAGGTSVLATWAVNNQIVQPFLGRNYNGGVTSRNVQLIREGLEYGEHNLHQLDMKLSKRFDIDRYRIRLDFDVYNLFNSSWPFTVNNNYSTATSSQWQRPTNVLTQRFFKLGGQFSF